MVKSNRYSPTNKKFKSHFENFASDKVKKGHLNAKEDEKDETAIKTGTLVRIERQKLYDNGWEVKVDKKTYHCTYSGNVMSIPKSTVTEKYFVPEKKCEVEIQIDKKTKIYNIVRIKDVNLTPIALYDGKLTLSSNSNDSTNKDNKANITISKTGITLNGDIDITKNINVKGDVIGTNIEKLESQVKTLEEQAKDSSDIDALQKQITELKAEIEELQKEKAEEDAEDKKEMEKEEKEQAEQASTQTGEDDEDNNEDTH